MFLTVVIAIVTACTAIYVEIGAVLAAPLGAAALVALVAWHRTSYQHAGRSDRVVVLYIAAIVALIAEHAEQWHADTPAYLMRIASSWVAPGFVFNERMFVVIFAIGSPALFLLGGFYLVRGRPLGDYMAWLLFVWCIFAGTIQGALAIGRGSSLSIVLGIAVCIPPLWLGSLGVRRLVTR
jgi:hypothetical protein